MGKKEGTETGRGIVKSQKRNVFSKSNRRKGLVTYRREMYPERESSKKKGNKWPEKDVTKGI